MKIQIRSAKREGNLVFHPTPHNGQVPREGIGEAGVGPKTDAQIHRTFVPKRYVTTVERKVTLLTNVSTKHAHTCAMVAIPSFRKIEY